MSASLRRSARLAALALLALAAIPDPAAGQYFGQNKVQYRTFDFRVLKTTHFDIYFYPEEEAATRDAARLAERWYARYSRLFDHEFTARQPLILYASHPHFQQTAALGGDISDGTGGVTEAFKQRVILPFAGPYRETDHVLGHELVHAFQYDITGVGRAGGGLESALQRSATPLWFSEGMAEYLSLGPVDPHTAMWLRDAALSGRVPTIEQITRDQSYFPYRWGQALWAYVGGRWGDATIGQILKQVGQGVPYPEAFQRILNTSLEEISDDWQTSIRRTYLPLLTERREAREQARPLITEKRRGGQINLAPSVSPDGRYVAFLSELNFLDVELFLADAETGRVIRRLVRGTAFDPHFASLRYINSAGAFSHDSKRFAFSALSKAQDRVVVLDVDRARILREYSVDGVGEISNPTWSPDGRSIVFSGISGGISDLWMLDTETGAARKLTDDRYADVQPAFSPDGRTVAFVTDRGPDTNLDSLVFGTYKLALMDVATGQIRMPPVSSGPRTVNPSWGRGGTSLFFLSDRTGIPNIYRMDVATNAVTQVTNLFTGVSGITHLSPAISSASAADRLVFNAYERGGYNIYSISNPTELAGTPVPGGQQQWADGSPQSAPLAAVLPPAPRPAEPAFNRVAALLRNASFGLPPVGADSAWRVVPYRPRLSLDYLGQPQVGVQTGGGMYGQGGVYGGIGGIFSDVLGYHTVYGTIQAQGQLDEIGFSTIYLNQRQRWNYGVSAQRLPYIAGAGQRQVFDEEEDVLRDQLLIFRYFDTRLGGVAQYPFSQVQRAEFAAGFRRISQDVQIREYIYEPVRQNGAIVGYVPVDYRESKEDAPAFNLWEASAALVYDNALTGFTSPFAGQRYHFEVAPTMGTGQFIEAIADYRRYLFVRPMTLALRGMHFGRYGRDERLFGEQFLGYPFFMRGYAYSDVRDRCSDEAQAMPSGGTECRVFGQLFGSKVAVANAELRVPLLSSLIGVYGLSPLEGIAFFDAGVAWGEFDDPNTGDVNDSRPVLRRGFQNNLTERGILTSAGAGARLNVFNYVIVEAVYVNAMERDRGWHWQFSFQPGF